MNHKVPVQSHEGGAALDPAQPPATADLSPGSQPDASASNDATGTSGSRSDHGKGGGTAPAGLRHPRNNHMNIFDKNNHVTWLAVCIVIAGIVGWILLHTGVIH